MKVKELLNYKGKWTKGEYVRDKNGNKCLVLSKEAVKWCLVGAISKCYFPKRASVNGVNLKHVNKAYDKIKKVLKECTLYDTLEEFNDNKKTTFGTVKKVLELANV